jgi:hypothetical protein
MVAISAGHDPPPLGFASLPLLLTLKSRYLPINHNFHKVPFLKNQIANGRTIPDINLLEGGIVVVVDIYNKKRHGEGDIHE